MTQTELQNLYEEYLEMLKKEMTIEDAIHANYELFAVSNIYAFLNMIVTETDTFDGPEIIQLFEDLNKIEGNIFTMFLTAVYGLDEFGETRFDTFDWDGIEAMFGIVLGLTMTMQGIE